MALMVQKQPRSESLRRISQMLMARPVRDIGQGIGQAASTLSTAWLERQRRDEEDARRQGVADTLGKAGEALSGWERPWTNPDTSASLAAALAGREEQPQSFGAPEGTYIPGAGPRAEPIGLNVEPRPAEQGLPVPEKPPGARWMEPGETAGAPGDMRRFAQVLLGNEETAPYALNILSQQAQPEAFTGQPFEATDATGKPVLVQRGDRGTFRPVADYGPAAKKETPRTQKSKKVWNATTGQLEFATEEQIAASAGTLQPAPSGQRLEVGPDGGVTLVSGDMANVGGQQPLDKKIKRDLQKDLVGLEESFVRLDNIRDRYNPEFLTWMGQGRAWLAGIKAKGGVPRTPEEKKFAQDRKKFEFLVEQDFNAYRKEITGAAASVQELERLQKAMLNMDLDSDAFEAVLEEYEAKVKRMMRLKRRLLRDGIYVGTSEFGEAFDQMYLGNEDDSLELRGAELREKYGSGPDADENIFNTLQAEGYRET